jgi:hypothetical protein
MEAEALTFHEKGGTRWRPGGYRRQEEEELHAAAALPSQCRPLAHAPTAAHAGTTNSPRWPACIVSGALASPRPGPPARGRPERSG